MSIASRGRENQCRRDEPERNAAASRPLVVRRDAKIYEITLDPVFPCDLSIAMNEIVAVDSFGAGVTVTLHPGRKQTRQHPEHTERESENDNGSQDALAPHEGRVIIYDYEYSDYDSRR